MGLSLSDKPRKNAPNTKRPDDLPTPERGAKVYYEEGGEGFGVRVTAKGVRSFVVDYRTRAGQKRRYTIGRCKDWSVNTAREKAKAVLFGAKKGEDPIQERSDEREAPTVATLAGRYIEEHLPSKRPSSQHDDKAMIAAYILPALKNVKVADVDFSRVSKLHRDITRDGKPYRANRVLALLSKMFSLANRWRVCTENPCKGVQKNTEEPRERYLEPDELERLMKVLVEYPDRQAANAIMLLLLTGARKSEVVRAPWSEFDLTKGIWAKPSSHTKQKRAHRVPLNPAALELLKAIKNDLPDAEYVFPGRIKGKPRDSVEGAWRKIRSAAGLEDVRLHDLRHTYASLLISDGVSLPIIGRLLGHTQAQTTMRYAHLADEPLREATNRVGKRIREA
jgi:integrase